MAARTQREDLWMDMTDVKNSVLLWSSREKVKNIITVENII